MTIFTKTLPQNFGMKIKLERIKQNLTQKKLAELTGINTNILYYIEKGKRMPKIDATIKLAEPLNLTLEELMDFDFDKYLNLTP